MKNEKSNQESHVKLTLSIEKELALVLTTMSKNSGMSEDEIVTIALKRFRASHAELEGCAPRIE